MHYLIANCNSEGQLQAFNKALVDLFQYEPDALLGMSVSDLLVDDNDSPIDFYQLSKSNDADGQSCKAKCHNGKLIPLQLSCSSYYNPGSQDNEFSIVARSSTKEKKVNNADVGKITELSGISAEDVADAEATFQRQKVR